MPNDKTRLAPFALALAGALALGACSGKDDTVEAENESVESVASKVAKSDLKPRPGRWEAALTMEKLEIPGMPPQAAEAMNKQLGQVRTSVTCLTQEDVDKADGEMFKPQDDSGCKYNKFSMGGGAIEADMTCEDGQMSQNMKMSGTYSEDAYAMQISADGKMQGQPMSMQMSVNSKRVGECDGKEAG